MYSINQYNYCFFYRYSN